MSSKNADDERLTIFCTHHSALNGQHLDRVRLEDGDSINIDLKHDIPAKWVDNSGFYLRMIPSRREK
jgi:hypothetical protein